MIEYQVTRDQIRKFMWEEAQEKKEQIEAVLEEIVDRGLMPDGKVKAGVALFLQVNLIRTMAHIILAELTYQERSGLEMN